MRDSECPAPVLRGGGFSYIYFHPPSGHSQQDDLSPIRNAWDEVQKLNFEHRST